MKSKVIKPVAKDANNHDVIPAKVGKAIEVVRDAVVKDEQSGRNLLVACVQLYVTCQTEGYTLKGKDAASMTGASEAYISRVFRATSKRLEAKHARPLQNAAKLGFREYIGIAHMKPHKKRRKGSQEAK